MRAEEAEQENYHGGLDEVLTALTEHARLTAISKEVYTAHHNYMGGIAIKLAEVVDRLEHLKRAWNRRVDPPIAQACLGAKAAQDRFHQTFPNIDQSLVLQAIAAGMGELEERTRNMAVTSMLQQGEVEAVIEAADRYYENDAKPADAAASAIITVVHLGEGQHRKLAEQITFQRSIT